MWQCVTTDIFYIFWHEAISNFCSLYFSDRSIFYSVIRKDINLSNELLIHLYMYTERRSALRFNVRFGSLSVSCNANDKKESVTNSGFSLHNCRGKEVHPDRKSVV